MHGKVFLWQFQCFRLQILFFSQHALDSVIPKTPIVYRWTGLSLDLIFAEITYAVYEPIILYDKLSNLNRINEIVYMAAVIKCLISGVVYHINPHIITTPKSLLCIYNNNSPVIIIYSIQRWLSLCIIITTLILQKPAETVMQIVSF